MSFEVDVTELLRLGDDLEKAAAELIDKVKPAVVKGAVNVKATMRADMAGSRHFGQVARSIGFDEPTVTAASVEAQVGPATGGATVGDLAHFAYFGGAHGGGGSVRDPQAAADEEAPGFEAAVAKIIDGLL